jgi:hypothetical protein
MGRTNAQSRGLCSVTCENAAMKKLVAQFNSYLRNFRLERISLLSPIEIVAG